MEENKAILWGRGNPNEKKNDIEVWRKWGRDPWDRGKGKSKDLAMGVCGMGSWHKMAECGWDRVIEGKTRRRQDQRGGQRVLRLLQTLASTWNEMEGAGRIEERSDLPSCKRITLPKCLCHTSWRSLFQFCLCLICMMIFFCHIEVRLRDCLGSRSHHSASVIV